MTSNPVRNLETPASVAAGAAVFVGDLTNCSVQLGGTFVGTVKTQASVDKTTWTDLASSTSAALTAVTAGYKWVRMNTTAYTSGTPSANAAGVKTDDPSICRTVAVPVSVAAGTAIFVGDVDKPAMAQFGGTFTATVQLEGSVDGTNFYSIGSAATAAGPQAIADEVNYVRANTTAYTSGTPTLFVGGYHQDVASRTTKTLEVVKFIATIGSVASASQGTTGATTYSYKLVGLAADGVAHTAASTAGTATDGNATLTSVNKQTITWTNNALALGGYDIYRTAGGATQGKIGHVAAAVVTFDDTGLTADGTTAPTTNTTGIGAGTFVGDMLAMNVIFGATFVATTSIEESLNGTDYFAIGSAVTAKGASSITAPVCYLRLHMTAYTSGAPVVSVTGAVSTVV